MQRVDPSPSLFADLYQLTMAQALWQSGTTAKATFSLYFREHLPGRAFYVFAGLHEALEHLQRFSFETRDIEYLGSTGLFDSEFMDYLLSLRFTGRVRAMPEGAIVFAGEPVIEVSAPMIEAQIPETFLVNSVNANTLLASKAARIVHAAHGRNVYDFAARRTHGLDAADIFARVSYMVGFDGTSNLTAGARHGIPVVGTMAHSFVSAFEDETDAYRAYARSFPAASTLLVDTYDTLNGTLRAIQVAREMRAAGHELNAIRLDSGNLAELSMECRALLNRNGFGGVRILASGALDEYSIEELLRVCAPIDGFGVGTKAGVSHDAPWADSVYKVVAYDGRPVMKLSDRKETMPGSKQVYRYLSRSYRPLRDVMAAAGEARPAVCARPMLTEVMRNGEITVDLPDLGELKSRFAAEFAKLDMRYKKLHNPDAYEVAISDDLSGLHAGTAARLRRRSGASIGESLPERA